MKKFYESYRRIAGKLFDEYADKRLDRFKSIHTELKKSNMGYLLREYISICMFTTILTAIISFPVSLIFLILIGKSLIFTLMFSGIITAAATGGVFVVSLKYPATKASERKRDIDNNLPFACLYMNTIAGTGAPPHLIFKLLSDFKEYGELSKEAQGIIEEIEVMGQDIEVALQRAAEKTPSEDFRDLLWGMITTIVRGGDLRTLLQEKSVLLMDQYRRKMDQYTDDLTMYVEIYITLVIVGSIFSLVMLTIMGAISGFAALKAMQEIMVYVFLPLTSTVFILLLKLTSPIT